MKYHVQVGIPAKEVSRALGVPDGSILQQDGLIYETVSVCDDMEEAIAELKKQLFELSRPVDWISFRIQEFP